MKMLSHTPLRCRQYLTLAAISMLLLSPLAANARKNSLRIKPPTENTVSRSDRNCLRIDDSPATLRRFQSMAPAISFAGYDKTATADKESIFISNKTGENIAGLEFEITYLTPDGEQLHRRSVKVNLAIPDGETRRYDFKSWDTQHAFHYSHSIESRRPSSPYDVTINLSALLLYR